MQPDKKGKTVSLMSNLKKVYDRYNYEGMEFPASYRAISLFEHINGVCVLIFEFDSEGKIILGQQGRLGHLTNCKKYLFKDRS